MASNKLPPLHVLVVDDNVDTARLLAMLLCSDGHDATVAADGPACLAAVRDRKPDVILLDISLPGLDGFEVCRYLRQEPGLERTMVVAVTGCGQEEDQCRAREVGFDAYLLKPAESNQLHELLARATIRRATTSS